MVVLGMLFLRALVPAGFMLAPVDGSLNFVLCEPALMAGGHLHHHHPGGEPSAPHATQDPSCPYAQSAGSAPLPSLPASAAGQATEERIALAAVTQTRLGFGPTRQQTPRGPPSAA